MACCGPSEQKFYNENDLLKKLRKIGNEKKIEHIKMNLISNVKENKKNKKIECEFDGEKWNDNIDEIFGSINYIDEKEEEQIKNLKQKINERELEIDALEREYLAKTIKLLYMVQEHVDIKVENEGIFDQCKMKEGNFLPEIKGVSNLDDNNSEIKEEKKKEAPIPA